MRCQRRYNDAVRALLLCLFAACGGTTSTAPAANVATEPASIPAVDDGPEDCASSIEDAAPGNHDRIAFETPDGLYGYKNARGDVVIAPRFRFGYEFKPGGIAAAVEHDGTFVFIDPTGKVVAKAYAFDNGPDYFQEGHARIVDGRKQIGFINDRGEITIAPRFFEAESFCHGKAAVVEGGRTFYVDKRGNETAAPAEPRR